MGMSLKAQQGVGKARRSGGGGYKLGAQVEVGMSREFRRRWA